ncbi:DUF2127 domain-containing protein [Curtobacterium ammoniigenes]|uniref:DUF2127 domain-containing protein n=1 Tax=Curtobacterium ammoniigenes TaxID=395387 RepID=UPI0008375C5A|nr:DUF2127 domain-containing protein [Curtobacterium ammoniigenes]
MQPSAPQRPANRHQRLVDIVFIIGVFFKGLDGVVELIAGIPLLFLGPSTIQHLAHQATADELQEDPHDLIAHLILHGTASLTAGATVLAAVYLIFHGGVKLAIVIALMFGKLRVYPWALAGLVAFLVLQIVQLTLQPSIGVAVLTVFDAIIIILTFREWREHRVLPEAWRNALGRPPRGAASPGDGSRHADAQSA